MQVNLYLRNAGRPLCPAAQHFSAQRVRPVPLVLASVPWPLREALARAGGRLCGGTPHLSQTGRADVPGLGAGQRFVVVPSLPPSDKRQDPSTIGM